MWKVDAGVVLGIACCRTTPEGSELKHLSREPTVWPKKTKRH